MSSVESDTLLTGVLMKKGSNYKTWKQRAFVFTKADKDKSGEISFPSVMRHNTCCVMSPESPRLSGCGRLSRVPSGRRIASRFQL